MENLKEQSSPIRVKRNKFIEETKREQQNSQLNFQFKNVSPRLAQKEIDEAILDLHK
jgi:t-SNARE complex subunit (syntaxin)